MGIGDAFKKFVGIEDEPLEITQEEIDREISKIDKAESSSGNAGNTANVSREPIAPLHREEPLSMGVGADKPYDRIAPMMNNSAFKNDRVSMNGSNPFKMVVIEPKHFDECSKLVDNLKARKPVIINLEKVETDLARKMFDFLSGATYALSGNVQRVTQNIYIFAPANVDIAAQLNRDATEAGLNSKTSSPWK